MATVGFGLDNQIEYDEKTYNQRGNLTALMLIGVYTDENEPAIGQAGDSNLLLLAVLDHGARTVRMLQLDWNTMVDEAPGGPSGSDAIKIGLAMPPARTTNLALKARLRPVNTCWAESKSGTIWHSLLADRPGR